MTGIHLGLSPESTFVAPRSELLSLSSVVPPSDEMDAVGRQAERARKKRPALASEQRSAPRPRHRRRRVDPAPVAHSGGAGSDGDLPSPQIKARREVKRRRYQPPVDEQTDWDPAPPAAMEAQAQRGRVRTEVTRTVTRSNARRAEKIFETAIAAYVRGDLESAAADAMLARVFDPTHDGYARAEHDWTDELRRPGRLLCSSQYSASSGGASSSSPAVPVRPPAPAPRVRRRRRGGPMLSAEAP